MESEEEELKEEDSPVTPEMPKRGATGEEDKEGQLLLVSVE